MSPLFDDFIRVANEDTGGLLRKHNNSDVGTSLNTLLVRKIFLNNSKIGCTFSGMKTSNLKEFTAASMRFASVAVGITFLFL